MGSPLGPTLANYENVGGALYMKKEQKFHQHTFCIS